MSDIGLTLGDDLLGDFTIAANDLAPDEGLETAVYLSLFTDARAPDGEVLPDYGSDRRGWWGDSVANPEGFVTGSRLWLLDREKQRPIIVQRAQQYAREALQWMIDDRVAADVQVEAEIVRHGVLGIGVTITRPRGDSVTYRYDYAWQQQLARGA